MTTNQHYLVNYSIHFIIIPIRQKLAVQRWKWKVQRSMGFKLENFQNIPKILINQLNKIRSFTDCPMPCSSFCSIYEITIFTCFFGSCFLILSVSILKLILVCSVSDVVAGGVLWPLLRGISLFLLCAGKWQKNCRRFWKYKIIQIGSSRETLSIHAGGLYSFQNTIQTTQK